MSGLFATSGFSAVYTPFAAKNRSLLQDLEHTIQTANSVLHDAENKRDRLSYTRGLSYTLENYIQELKDAVYDADDLFDEFLTLKHQLKHGDLTDKVLNFCSSNNPLKVAYSTSRHIKKIRQILDDIATENAFDAEVRFSMTPSRRRFMEETCSYVDPFDIIGRKDDANEVISKLLVSTNDIHFLSIVGVGGLGKTALTQLIYNDDRIVSNFEQRMWVCLSDKAKSLDVKETLLKILESERRRDVDNRSSVEYVQQEYRQCVEGKKCLLVLDDIWTENPSSWEELRRFLEMSGSGSRIIATTRSNVVASIIGGDTHELKGLSDKNSWILFKKMAFTYEQSSECDDFIVVGKSILEKCYNNPLVIKVVGSLLYLKPIDKWQQFEKNGFDGISYGDEVIGVLRISYDNLLPSVKKCFIYCALFPKDYVIKKEMIMDLWEAQGYIIPFEEGQNIENAGEEHFSILLQRNFLEEIKKNEYGDVDSFKIHGLMHDLAHQVSRNEICIINPSMPDSEYTARHLFDGSLINKDGVITASKIRSYIMLRKRWFVGIGSDLPIFSKAKLLKSWGCLRVLALQGLLVTSLPDTMGKLLHLRYLNLSKNSMKKLPDSVTQFYNLQTLNINKCDELEEWPKDFRKLVNLKNLYREKCYALRCMPIGMNKLTHLRVLTDFVVEDEGANGMQRVGQLKDLKALAKNLKKRLIIQFHVNFVSAEGYEWQGSCLEGAEHLKEVEIYFSFPTPVLYLRRMDEGRGVREELVMEKLQPHPNLRKFSLSYFAGYNISSWGRAQDNWATSLPNLVHIKFSECHRLQQLPLLSKLPHLKSLHLQEMKNLMYVEEEVTSTSGSGSLDTNTIFFPSLETLELNALKKLQRWSSFGDSSNCHLQPTFPQLSHLTIQNCPLLISFPHCLSLTKIGLRNDNEALKITTMG